MSEIRAALAASEVLGLKDYSGSRKAPSRVRWVPRLIDDIKVLRTLFDLPTPPKRVIRPSQKALVIYGFGDASGSGFGSSIQISDKLIYKSGQWNPAHQLESSNYRELSNLVYTLEESHRAGLLVETEIFLFTDNSTAEAAYFKGTSSSRLLFELVLRLHKIQMHNELLIHFVHVAGKRMIAQGTDGLSRGITCHGALQDGNLMQFIPLHLSVLDRQPTPITEWVTYWFGSAGPFDWLQPKDWFHLGHLSSKCVWTPPPAAVSAALEQLALSVHKRPQHMHLVIIPRLLTMYWRKLLNKICDLVFYVPIGTDLWSTSQFEPLIVGLSLPLCRHPPWKLRQTPMLDRVDRLLRGLPLSDSRWGGSILRQLLQQSGSLDSLQSSVVWPLLQTTR